LKGQTSVEFISILAVVLFVLAIILSISLTQVNSLTERIELAEARVSVDKLCNTADEISAMGKGSSIIVEVFIPNNYNKNLSYIDGQYINIFSYGSDINCRSSVTLDGRLPVSSGKQYLLVKSEGDHVLISEVDYS